MFRNKWVIGSGNWPVDHETGIRLIDLVITLIGLKRRKAPIIKLEPFSEALIVKII